ncbi:MAG: TIGR02757 family protein [Deltaproteobacteria bacterium]|nr:TIGR02757 family protein [Deltaproteobacteria bacterium]
MTRHPRRIRDLAVFLEAVYLRFHRSATVSEDPLSIPSAYGDPLDREVMGFVASAFAFGRVSAFMAKLSCVVDRLGDHPAARMAGLDAAGCREVASGLRHRFVGEDEIASLLLGLSHVVRGSGGLEPPFLRGFGPTGDVMDGLESLVAELWPPPEPTDLPGPGFLVASVRSGSPLKRFNLFLRWMVRDDGIDLGLWKGVPPSALLIPLDTHVDRIAQHLGILPRRRSGPRLAHAVALTRALREIDPEDPARFDFALSHLGISGQCRGRFHDAVCADCPLEAACRVAVGGVSSRSR